MLTNLRLTRILLKLVMVPNNIKSSQYVTNIKCFSKDLLSGYLFSLIGQSNKIEKCK